ncbi:hypothetical protein ACH5RR_038048 [Cinchona calisaya]|uniref:Cytochrome P450 n=1 Tax=Cinchona calisaya TaxID=153742 RepID=A0ABD2YBX0_9GENT
MPHRVLRDLAKKYGPIMQLQVGEVSTIVVSTPKTAKEVMKTHDIIFASRPHITASKILAYDSTSIAFSPYGEYWRQMRKICILELLNGSCVQSFQYIREKETSSLIGWLASNAGSPVNLTEKIDSCAYCITSKAAFGKKSKQQEKLMYISKEASTLAA